MLGVGPKDYVAAIAGVSQYFPENIYWTNVKTIDKYELFTVCMN